MVRGGRGPESNNGRRPGLTETPIVSGLMWYVHGILVVNRPDLLEKAVQSARPLWPYTFILDNSPGGRIGSGRKWPVRVGGVSRSPPLPARRQAALGDAVHPLRHPERVPHRRRRRHRGMGHGLPPAQLPHRQRLVPPGPAQGLRAGRQRHPGYAPRRLLDVAQQSTAPTRERGHVPDERHLLRAEMGRPAGSRVVRPAVGPRRHR